MFENKLYEKIVIEGNSPERALSRLQRAGICLLKVKKIKKNQILATVTKKDSEKVFAIYPNLCYNREDKKAYTVKKAGEVGFYKAIQKAKTRWGAALGAAVFLFLTSLSEFFVLGISVTGETSYAREAEEILSSHGVKKFHAYPKGREEKIATALLSLGGVTFASVQKSGVTVRVELRVSSFSDEQKQKGDMTADRTGVLISATVLSGTLLKKVGDTIYAGEPVVGGYVLTEDGKKAETKPSAKIVLSCVFEEFYPVATEEEAFERALLFIDGEVSARTAERTEKGYAVRIEYEYTQCVNF